MKRYLLIFTERLVSIPPEVDSMARVPPCKIAMFEFVLLNLQIPVLSTVVVPRTLPSGLAESTILMVTLTPGPNTSDVPSILQLRFSVRYSAVVTDKLSGTVAISTYPWLFYRRHQLQLIQRIPDLPVSGM